MGDRDLTEHKATEVAAGTSNETSQMLLDVIRLSMDPSVDGQKTTALAELAMKMQDREAERRFRMAKHRAVQQMPSINRRGAITNKQGGIQSRYSKFEDIMAVVKPILDKEHLILTFNVSHEGQMVTVQPILSYSDGEMAFEEKGGEMVLATDTTGSKNATQGAGSAASYGKRHSAKAMLNIVEEGEDNDGQSTAGPLPADRVALVDLAREKAKDGTEAYAKFFTDLSKDDKAFLTYNYGSGGESYHDQNKAAAALYD